MPSTPVPRRARCAALIGLLLTCGWGRAGGAGPQPVFPAAVRPVVTSPVAPRVATDDRQVYLMSEGQVRAYDPTLRQERWSAPLTSFGSLAVGNGLVLADDGFARLHAYDARTGRRVWTAPAPRPLTWGGRAPVSTPLRFLQRAGDVVLGATVDDVRAWDARTGQPRWQVGAGDPLGPFAVDDGVAVFGARTGIEGYSQGVKVSTGRTVWSSREGGEPLRVAGGRVFGYGRGYVVNVAEVRSGRTITVRYTFPALVGARNLSHPYVHDAQVCAEGTLRGARHVQCLPRTAGRYVRGDRALLTALRPETSPSRPVWEVQTRQVLRTVDGTWLLGGSRPVRLSLPRATPLPRGCSVETVFAEAGPSAVFSACAAFGPGRLAVVDLRRARVVQLIRAAGEVQGAWRVGAHLVVMTDKAVLSVPAP
ncbi:PQQ-binding-like beta-propeller repeat protein [Deinococcus planocerae]|uniref:outer membrane protein assembly factor BamB family protein n=1 Tax=Deinococcus planocerae TaxID=1737569 RepID=UPI0015E06DF0|nr:PQQ-binding-like beta-propeller repeat protein [Deinococcus planocerae]